MRELALMAATEWAKAHAPVNRDPVDFGRRVAQAYLAARATYSNAGDEALTAAALAALSVRPEVLQAISQLAALTPLTTAGNSQTAFPGAAK